MKLINVNTVRITLNTIASKIYESNKNIGITFQFMPVNIVISSILNLNSSIKFKKADDAKFQNFCIEFIECLNKHRLSN